MKNKYMKRSWTSLVIRKCKVTMSYHKGYNKRQWQHQMLAQMQRYWVTAILLEGTCNGTATLKDKFSVSYEIKDSITIAPSNFTLVHLYQKKKRENFSSHRDLYMNVYRNFTCNGKNLESFQMSFNSEWWSNSDIYHGILLRKKKKRVNYWYMK